MSLTVPTGYFGCLCLAPLSYQQSWDVYVFYAYVSCPVFWYMVYVCSFHHPAEDLWSKWVLLSTNMAAIT